MSETEIISLLKENSKMMDRISEIEELHKVGRVSESLANESTKLLEKVIENSLAYRKFRYGT